MSDNTEPVVTQEDREAAKALQDANVRRFLGQSPTEVLDLIAEHLAAHRTAAVARREKEIVAVVQELISGELNAADECDECGNFEGAEACRIAISSMRALVKKLQTGGGA